MQQAVRYCRLFNILICFPDPLVFLMRLPVAM